MTENNGLPPGWVTTELGKITEIIMGQSPPGTSYNSNGIGTPLINGPVEFGPTPFSKTQQTKFTTAPKKMCKKGDLILCVRGSTTGRMNIAGFDACIGRGVAAIRAGTYQPYINWIIHSKESDIYSLGTGSTFPNVTLSTLNEIVIPLPPLPEQKRIVAKIEELFTQLEAGVSELQQAKAQLQRYRQAVLKSAVEGELTREWSEAHQSELVPAEKLLEKVHQIEVEDTKRAGRLWGAGTVPELTEKEKAKLPDGWVWCKVQDLGPEPRDVVQVGPMSMRSKDFEDTGVPVLNVGCVQWGYFNESKLNYLPEQKAKKFERYRIKSGDVLFTRSGTVGRCAVAKEHQNRWLMTFHLLRVRTSPLACEPEYLRAVFEGASHIRRQTKAASIGTTRAGFNTRLLAELDVPLPPMREQRRIMEKVERRLSVADEIEKELDQALARSERLRQSILKYAFEGSLVEQGEGEA